MKDIRRTVLDLVVEDAYGLWELLWRVGTTEPGLSRAEAIRVTAKAVAELYDGGFIVLERCVAGASVPLLREEIHELSSKSALWEEPQADDNSVFIRATAKGENAYYS